MSSDPIGIAKAEHISKNHVRITVAEHYEITVFNIQGSDVEVVIVAYDGTEAARLRVAAPVDDERMIIDKAQDGSVVDIRYERMIDARQI